MLSIPGCAYGRNQNRHDLNNDDRLDTTASVKWSSNGGCGHVLPRNTTMHK